MLLKFTIYCNRRPAEHPDGHDGDVDIKTLLFAPFPDGSFEWTTPVDGLRMGDRRVLPDDPEYWETGDGPAARWRRRFRCPTCGDVAVFRDERFRPVVETLLGHGVSRVSLTGLRGRVRP